LAGARLGVDARRALGFDGARVLPDLRAAHCANLSAHRRRFGFSGGGGRGEAP
jgi:hypothetical protein